MYGQEEGRYTTSKLHTRKSEEKVKAFNDYELEKGNMFTLRSTVRIIVGGLLAILFIFKDLASVVILGTLRLVTETLRWFVNFIIRLTEEITVTSVRVILRGVEELFNVLFGVILQIVDNASRVIIRRLQQIIGVVGYSFIAVIFAVAYVIHRAISFLFSER